MQCMGHVNILTSQLFIHNWLFLPPYASVFSCLFPWKSSVLFPLPTFFYSSECPTVSLVQSKNVLPLHPIMCPRTLSSECPQSQRCSEEILILMMGVSRLDIRLDGILGQPWEGPEHGVTSPESLI